MIGWLFHVCSCSRGQMLHTVMNVPWFISFVLAGSWAVLASLYELPQTALKYHEFAFFFWWWQKWPLHVCRCSKRQMLIAYSDQHKNWLISLSCFGTWVRSRYFETGVGGRNMYSNWTFVIRFYSLFQVLFKKKWAIRKSYRGRNTNYVKFIQIILSMSK